MKNRYWILLIIAYLINPYIYAAEVNDLSKIIRFPFQDSTKSNYCQSQPLINNNQIFLFYTANETPEDSIYLTHSSDDGLTWDAPTYVAVLGREEKETVFLSGIRSKSGRLLLVFTIGEAPVFDKTKIVYSDDNGISWTAPKNVIGNAFIPYPKISETPDGKLWVVGRVNYFFYSSDDGISWNTKNIGFNNTITTAFDLVAVDSSNYIMAYDKFDSFSDTYKVLIRKSTDSGNSWSEEFLITEENKSEQKPRFFKETSGTLWLLTQSKDSTAFTTDYNIFEQDILYRKSSNMGESWTPPNKFTTYPGFDAIFNICAYNDLPLITFLSDRWIGVKQIWIGQMEVTPDNDFPPVLYHVENSNAIANVPISIRAFVGSASDIQKTELFYDRNGIKSGPIIMFDDGQHDDEGAGDNIWGISIGPFDYYDVISINISVTDINLISATIYGGEIILPPLPETYRWLSAGSLHNWFSSRGAEVEEGYVQQQLYGLQWPGIYKNQNMQASKGFWIGAVNFTDQNNRFFPYKVVHVGPRVTGELEFFPKEFKVLAKFNQPDVIVNTFGAGSSKNQIDEIDPNIPCERMIHNVLNTQLGITIERNIYQFSQEYHDNYLINQYTFTNTGNVDNDDFIELPNTTISGIYFYYLFRWAINNNTRYVIGNATGWGINTMLDTRGDGIVNDPVEENFRAQYAWHGKYPPFTLYDNIGGPIWNYPGNGLYVDQGDTIGRLAANQFIGVVTLHADVSASIKNDDTNQPSTTSWEGSDGPLTSNNDAFDDKKMADEYSWMSKGHKSPRHANAVEPSGNFIEPINDPALGTPGGFAAANGYGPYTLGPGESITITWAEAASGISREMAIDIGRQYKWGQISSKQKNEIVFTGKDSLFKTFHKAIVNFNNGNGYIIPQPPYPPYRFEINSGADEIHLIWEHSGQGPVVKGFEIYRSAGSYDSVYQLIHSAGPTLYNRFIDTSIQRGINYYYYIQTVGDASDNNGNALTPLGPLKSSRYYTQTYIPAQSTITDINDEKISAFEYVLFQNHPNPFNPSTTIKYSVPEQNLVIIKICDVLGREVMTLVNEEKPMGNYEISLNAEKLSSGIYFYRMQAGDFVQTKKMVLMK